MATSGADIELVGEVGPEGLDDEGWRQLAAARRGRRGGQDHRSRDHRDSRESDPHTRGLGRGRLGDGGARRGRSR
jgi:hypothetical protein